MTTPAVTRSSHSSAEPGSVLVLNSGSSSLKFALFTRDPEPAVLCRGTIGDAARTATVARVFEQVNGCLAARPLAAIGHRIVHGGPSFSDPQIVTDQSVATLRSLVHFAPNHLPAELDLIEEVRRLEPDLPQVLCFDTAFHATMPEVARRLAIPQIYADQGVHRYGFHGLSYTFLVQELGRRSSPAQANGNVVMMHLGNGSSVAAVRAGRSVDTSMGMTPIGGVVMSTRSGDLDPGVVTFIARSTGFDADRLEREFSHDAGLTALSGGVADMRELLDREAGDAGCRLAVAVYCYEIRKRIGAYAAALGGLDAVVFSGGIGEHAPAVRARICDGLEFLGVAVDDQRNRQNAPVISTATGRVAIHVIPADEEVVIAQAAGRLLGRRT
jgi:acetate kinase